MWPAILRLQTPSCYRSCSAARFRLVPVSLGVDEEAGAACAPLSSSVGALLPDDCPLLLHALLVCSTAHKQRLRLTMAHVLRVLGARSRASCSQRLKLTARVVAQQ